MIKLKKLASLFMALTMTASIVAMSACGEEKTPSTSDSVVDSVVDSSNDSSDDVVPCDKHVFSEEPLCIKEPTCTENGKKAIACINCKTPESESSVADIAARGHDYGNDGKCIRCGLSAEALLPKVDSDASYINLNDTQPDVVGDDYNRYQINAAQNEYYELDLPSKANHLRWISVAVDKPGQYALVVTNDADVTVKRYDASSSYIPHDGTGTETGNYLYYAAGKLSDGKVIATVDCTSAYWSADWRATFSFESSVSRETVRFRILKIEEPGWEPSHVIIPVSATEINGTAAPEGPDGAIPIEVPMESDYFFNEATGYYHTGTPENPGDIIYLSVTNHVPRMFGEESANSSFSRVAYELKSNMHISDGTTADGDYRVLDYCPMIMEDHDADGATPDQEGDSYEKFVNSDGMYPVTQELHKFLTLYTNQNKPMGVDEMYWTDAELKANQLWLAPCYIYATVAQGSINNPYTLTSGENTVALANSALSYCTYSSSYTYSVSCDQDGVFLNIDGETHLAPFSICIEGTKTFGVANTSGEAGEAVIVIGNANGTANGSDISNPNQPFVVNDGENELKNLAIYGAASPKYEAFYSFTATETNYIKITVTNTSDLTSLFFNITHNNVQDGGEINSDNYTITATAFENGVAVLYINGLNAGGQAEKVEDMVQAGETFFIQFSAEKLGTVEFTIEYVDSYAE